MLAIDTWQALNAFIEAVIAASCLVASVGECRRQRAKPSYQGCRGWLLLGYGWGKAHGLNCVGYFWEMNTSGGHYDTPLVFNALRFEQEKSAFCLLAFMYAVKNGYHVQLGVSLSRNIKTALLQSWACKRKSIFCQSLCSLNCVAWLYINFSNHRKPVSPEGANLLPVMVAEHMSLEKLISAPSGKSNAVQWEERTAKPPKGFTGFLKLLSEHAVSFNLGC